MVRWINSAPTSTEGHGNMKQAFPLWSIPLSSLVMHSRTKCACGQKLASVPLNLPVEIA